jgi:hypothetical protein
VGDVEGVDEVDGLVELGVDQALGCGPCPVAEAELADSGERVELREVRGADLGERSVRADIGRVVGVPGDEHPGLALVASLLDPVGGCARVAGAHLLLPRQAPVAEAGADGLPVVQGEFGRLVDRTRGRTRRS